MSSFVYRDVVLPNRSYISQDILCGDLTRQILRIKRLKQYKQLWDAIRVAHNQAICIIQTFYRWGPRNHSFEVMEHTCEHFNLHSHSSSPPRQGLHLRRHRQTPAMYYNVIAKWLLCATGKTKNPRYRCRGITEVHQFEKGYFLGTWQWWLWKLLLPYAAVLRVANRLTSLTITTRPRVWRDWS